MPKEPTSFRLSPEALAIIREVAERLGVSQAQVIEQAVQEYAREQALHDWSILKDWWRRVPPETKARMLELTGEEQ